jgi:hypothetical protein
VDNSLCLAALRIASESEERTEEGAELDEKAQVSGKMNSYSLSDEIDPTYSLRNNPELEAEMTAIASTTPLKEAIKEIDNVISCLYRLSITIENPASQDKLEKMERLEMSHFERFDIEHISNKYQLPEDYQYLIERLGKVNTKRRQLLKYHNENYEKIVGRRVAVNATGATDCELGPGSEDDFYSEDMHTTVSTQYEYSVNLDLVEAVPLNLDSRSEAGFSVTSYASSTADSGNLRVPAPPLGFDKGPFQCPYCFIIVETENRAAWK